MFTVKNISLESLQTFYENFAYDKTFLQSAPFVDYRRRCGENLLIEGYFQADDLVAVAVMQALQTRLKRWLHVPHGPLVKPEVKADFWPWWFEHYAQMGRRLKKDLVRVSPLVEISDPLDFAHADFKPAATHLVNPEKTWVLDITPTADDLLAGMKKSTRYEVRKSIKPETGLQVTINHNLDAFWDLHQATVARQQFVPFTKNSTAAEIKAFGNDCQIITVWHEAKPLASGVFLFDDRAVYYHQGASIHSKLPAAHGYMWAAIMEGKKRNCTEFNFWGVCGEDHPSHPWYGLSKFKRGFGGHEKNYHHVHDYALTWRAGLNRMIETRRKRKRGY